MAYTISEHMRNRINAAGTRSLAASSMQTEAPTATTKKKKKNKGGVLGGIGYTLGQLGTGFFGVAEGVYDFLVGGVADIIGQDEYAIRLHKDDITGRWQKGLDDWYNPSKAMDFVGDVAGGLGQTATYVGLNLIPVAGQALSAGAMFTSAAGRGVTSAYQKTGKLGAKEWIYGFGSGTVEAGLELATGTVGKIAGSIKGVSKNVAKSAVRSGVLRSMWDAGKGEFVEESLSELIDPYLQRATIDPNAKNASLQEIVRAGMVGFVSGAVGGAAGTTIGNVGSLNRGKRITKTGNEDFTIYDRRLGERTASSGSRDAVLQRAQTLLSKIDNAQNAETVAGNLLALKGTYDAYNKLSNKGGIRGQMLLGEMARNIAYTELSGGVEASKADIKQHADTLAQYLTEQKGQTYTAEDIKNNKDGILTDLAIADFSAKMLIDPDTALAMVKRGESGVLDMASQYEAWKGNLTAEQLQEANTALGIDLSTSTFQDFNKAMGAFNANPQQQQPSIETRKAQAQPMPDSISLQDGETAVYKTDSGEYLAVKKEAEGYLVAADDANGNGLGKSAKHLTEEQVNELVKGVKQGKQAPTETSKVKEVKAKMETSALTEEGRAMVKDFDNLPASTQARIREMIATGKKFNTVSQADMEFVANLMAVRRGVNITFADMGDNGVYTSGKNGRYIQLNGNNASEAVRSAAIHELGHDLKKSPFYKELCGLARDFVPESVKKQWEQEYRDYYAQKNWKIDEEILDEEINSRSLESVLNNKSFWSRHLNQETGSFIERARNTARRLALRFKGVYDPASRAYLKLGKMFDAVLASPAIVDGDSVNADSYNLSIDTFAEALGLTYEKGENGETIFKRKDGTIKEKITIDDIKNSPIGALVNYANISDEDKQKQYNFFVDLFGLMQTTQDIDLIWAVSSPLGFQPIKAGERAEETKENYGKNKFAGLTTNSDPQYKSTIDFTTICLKTKAIIDVMSKTMIKLNRGLTQDEVIDIVYKEVFDSGEPVPCPVCYVFSRWVGVGGLLDSMNELQTKYDKASEAQLRADFATLEKKVDEVIAKSGKSGARDVVEKDLRAQKKILDQQINTDKIKGVDSLTEEQKAEHRELTEQLAILDKWTWFKDVRMKKNYKPVPKEILFDMNRAQEFATDYPAAWKYRTTRGPAMGKAITPYSAENLGQIITGLSVADLQKIVANPDKNPFYGASGGRLTDAMKYRLTAAKGRVKAQNLLNGQRFQSNSDWRFEYGLDYVFAMLELQALESTGQLYTKVPEAVDFLASCGVDVNCSLMPLGDGFDKNGNLAFSRVTGMDERDAFAFSQKYDSVQPIMVGISREHILACLRDDRITFVIPYHASGAGEERYTTLMAIVKENVEERTDFSNYQTDSRVKNPTNEQELAYSARLKILQRKKDISAAEMKTIEGNRFLNKLYHDFYLNENPKMKGAKLSADQAKVIFPYEFWDKNTTYETSYKNSEAFKEYCESLGVHPRFSGWNKQGKYNADMDFSNEPFYWKMLIDRKMYANDGSYREQTTINLTGATTDMLLRDKAVQGVNTPSKINDPQKAQKIADNVVKKISADKQMMSINTNEDVARGLVEKIKGEIERKRYWSAKDLFGYVDEHPEINFIERLYNNDASVKKDLTKFLDTINNDELLEKFSFYMRNAYSDKDSHINWDTLKREFPYRGAVATFRNAVNKRIKTIITEKVKGTNLEIQNGEYSLKKVKSLFDKLNQNEEIGELAEKVFATAQKLGVNVRFVNKMLSSTSGVRGDQIADMVEYKTSFFNDTSETDQTKATVILHELIHTCTVYVMNETDSTYGYSNSSKSKEYVKLVNAGVGLNKIFDQIRFDSELKNQYGNKSAKEMVAELANPEYVELLKKKNLWERVLDWLCDFFGITKKASAYESARMCLDYILDNADYSAYREYSNSMRQKMWKAGMQTFTSNNISDSASDTTRLSIPTNTAVRNKEYMDAVNRNDMETAQRMVDEAAKEAGYKEHLYHGTNADFTKFDLRKHGGRNGKGEGYGIYLAANREISAPYGKNIIDSYVKFNRLAEGRKKTLSYNEVKSLVKRSCEIEAQRMVDGEEYDSVSEALKDTWVSNIVYTYDYSNMSQVYADVANKLWKENDNDGDLINEIMALSGAHYDYNNALDFYDNILTPITGIDGFHYIWGNKDGSGEQNDIYLAFRSNQIKSADPVTYDDNGNVIPLSERFKSDNEDIRYSIPYAPTGKTNIAMTTKEDKRAWKDRLREAYQWTRVNFIDRQAAIEDAFKAMGVKDGSAYIQAARSATSQAQRAIGSDIYDITAFSQGKEGKVLSKGIDKVMQPVRKANLEAEFFDYLFNLHNIDRLKVNKPVNGNTAEESQQAIKEAEKAHPEFKEWQKDWSDMVNALMTLRLNAGLITQEQYDYLTTTYPHYVPTFREEGGKQGSAGDILGRYDLSVKRTIRKATGSTDTLLRPDEMIARQTLETYRAIAVNNLINRLYEAGLLKGSTDFEIVSREKMGKKEATDDMGDIVNLETVNDTKPNSANNTITFYKDGEKITLKVSKNMFEGFEGLHPGQSVFTEDLVLKGLRKVMNAFKAGVTNYNPTFLIRNALRDLQDAGIYTKNGAGFAKAYPKAYKEITTNGKLWQLYLAAGGMSSSVFDTQKGFTGTFGKHGFDALEGNIGKKALQGMENFNVFIEQLPRFTEFVASLESGKTVNEALLDSADVTVNFGRAGKITKIANTYVVPFLNAAVQGASKTFRTFTARKTLKQWASLVVRCAILGIAPAVLSNIMYGDDEDYQNLRTEDKENYFLFKVGDKFIKLPKGRLAGLMSGLVNRTWLTSKEGAEAWEGYFGSAMETLAPVESASRAIWSPFFDVKNNTTWYGSPIEGRQFDDTAIKDRYDESTSSIAIALGKTKTMQAIGYSPKKIHYLLDQYFGVAGDVILPIFTQKAEKGMFSAAFTVDPVTNNKLSTKFYKIYDEATYAKTAGDENAALALRYLNKVKTSVSELQKQKREIQNSKLSDKEKIAESKIIQGLINQAYTNVIEEYDQMLKAFASSEGLGDNYTVVEVTKSNYKKLEESKDNIGSFVIAYKGLTTNKVYESQDKAQDGLSSMISDYRYAEGIRAMYGSEMALKNYNAQAYEKAQKLNAAGIDYDTYYNAYFLIKQYAGDSADKRDYALSIIESLDLTRQQRLMLIYSLGYSVNGEIGGLSSKAAKRVIANYIKGLRIKSEEKIALAKACGLTVKNGKIVVNS